jgi:hypothetical protein
MRGSFSSGRFRFQVEGRDRETDLARGFREDLEDDSFYRRLTDTRKVPDLGGAPIASWLLARLARLTDGRLGFAGRHDSDGGGYMVEFVVYLLHPDWVPQTGPSVQLFLFNMAEFERPVDPEKPVASFQFQADMQGAAVIGRRTPDCPAEQLLHAFATALLAAPTDLMGRELEVYDPEWREDPSAYKPRPTKSSRNWYGWDGFHFLGKDNIRDRPYP